MKLTRCAIACERLFPGRLKNLCAAIVRATNRIDGVERGMARHSSTRGFGARGILDLGFNFNSCSAHDRSPCENLARKSRQGRQRYERPTALREDRKST